MLLEELYAYKQLVALNYELEQQIKQGGGAYCKQQLKDVKRKLGKISDFILGCSDPLIKEIMILRFTRFMSWESIAAKIGGYNSGGSCRMLVIRYVSRSK